MLLVDWEGIELPTFQVFKIAPSKVKEKRVQNDKQRHGSSSTKWNRKIRPLQERHNCQIYDDDIEANGGFDSDSE
ncbi:hypothetical protein PPTG_23010 [Phytophthora nicotianae INRA-310]|uniref:Uncharacterized protein n=1 Tax=Phytophthora nicotianae (strain INRA-310) TaxID=761204 RepID=W2Q7Z8_PHYN3|nr:hypothetical protein PPTG_23010 [Phytophthora nicotianae INRA-310]ETN08385.1 hypothetical protein PPTG_23010 [Phytophthora nicotianae INRA-310]